MLQWRDEINLHAGRGVAVREFQTDTGPADYALFVDGRAVGVVEAKKTEELSSPDDASLINR